MKEDDNKTCINERCVERLDQHTKEIDDVKSEMSKMKEEITDIKLDRAKDNEQIATLYRIVDDFKKSIGDLASSIKSLDSKMEQGFKEVNQKIDTQNDKIYSLKTSSEGQVQKEDSFQEWLSNIGRQTVEYAIKGGIVFFIVYLGLKIVKIVP